MTPHRPRVLSDAEYEIKVADFLFDLKREMEWNDTDAPPMPKLSRQSLSNRLASAGFCSPSISMPMPGR